MALSGAVRERCGLMRSIVVFTGHMIDKVGRVPPHYVPRFPLAREAQATAAIRAALDRLDAGIGYSSAACGADIIFLEQMLERGAEVHVVLPYGEEQFLRDCIEVPAEAGPGAAFQQAPGREWLPRYRALRDRLAGLVTLGDKRPQDNSMASECCNRAFLGLGLLKARAEARELSLLALWDGWSGDAPGGTRSLVRLADSLGIALECLPDLQPASVQDILRTATPPPGIGAAPLRAALGSEPPQQICAVLFADFVDFSKLDETMLPGFVSGYLSPLARIIQNARLAGYGPMDFNTWGDGLFCVFDSMLKAGIFALELQGLAGSGEWSLAGSGATLDLRIALHAGPVYRVPDPVYPKDTFVGTNISFAARIEPVTAPGEIWCSQTFAALAAAEGVGDFRCEPLGPQTLPKQAGTHPLYRLAR